MSETNERASRRALLLISIATVFALSVWFSTNAIAPALETAKGLSGGDIAWLTIAVQLGFVAGTLFISFTNLADLVSARTLFGVSAIIAGVLNLAVIPLEGVGPVIAARFATGMFLGGVYPPGMKILAGWFQRGRGIALGAMIGALTLGSGSPHLLRSMFTDQWQTTIVGSSILAAAGGLIVWIMVGDGPYDVRGARFSPRYMFRVITERGPRFALLGYLGHQWELYAMWAWIGAYLAAVYGARPLIGDRVDLASMLAFAVFFAGAIASIGAGVLAEHFGRSLTTAGAMVMSGSIALAIGFVPFDWSVVIAVLALLWGASIVADSAQFSTAMIELGAPEYRGTMLTFQTGLGFALTTITIRLVPVIENAAGWGPAFALLAIGPALGAAAMMRLRALPESRAMAGGRR